MTKPTQMEKLDEIVRALEIVSVAAPHKVKTERFHDGLEVYQTEHCVDECPKCFATRALTLARELRENAVEGYAYQAARWNPTDWMFTEGPIQGNQPALLILSEPTP